MNFFRFNHTDTISILRINALQAFIFLLILGIVVRLFYVQIIDHGYYLSLGSSQRSVNEDVSPERGQIYASDMYPLAVNKVFYEVNVNPSLIDRPQNVADALASVLEMDQDQLLTKIKTDRKYEFIAKDISQEKVDLLKNNLAEIAPEGSVSFVKSVLRYYPDKEVGAHILGFLGYAKDGYKRVGKYGLEGYFENELAGLSGELVGEKDIAGRLLADSSGDLVKNGANLVLTIDQAIQYAACKALERGVAKYDAKGGSVIVLETATGAVKAMCGYPSFDPNQYNQVDNADVYNNNAVYFAYEPGSVMKVISMAIAIDQGKVTPSTIYEDKGEIKFARGEVIRNSDLKAHGLVDMKTVISESLNTGIIFATHEVNNKIFADYIKNFGFGTGPGLTISQESAGNIDLLDKSGDIYKATASFGQGMTATPLQIVAAVNVIANQGEYMRPYIVTSLEYADGSVEKIESKSMGQVISKATASQVSAMMVYTVDNGHSYQAAVPGYYVAGKTGTAQVVDPNTGKYYSDKTFHTFVGFAPNENPKFTMVVKLDYPTAARFAESTAAPIFGEIAKFLLEYYKIAPTR